MGAMLEVSASDLAQASSVLVQTALKLRTDDNFVVICDAETDALAHALRRAAEAAGARVTVARLDLLRSIATNTTGERPHKVLPDAARRALQVAQASCYVASAPHQELSMREQMLHLIGAFGVRHCHMPGTTPQAFVNGLRLGYDKVASWGHGMLRRLELAKVLESDSAAGTKLRVTLAPSTKWIERLGEIPAGRSVTFPAGALYATPESVDGVFVANASVGEFFGAHAGLLLTTPVRFTLKEGRVTAAEAVHAPDLLRDVRSMLELAPNSERVGLVAVGVNVGIHAPTGDALVDQNMPGLHLVLGDPMSRESGASWHARTQFAVCQAGGRLVIDGTLTIDGSTIVSVL